MKKSFFNKQTKQLGLLILLMASLVTTGCRHKSKFEKGFEYTLTPKSIMLGIRSDTDTFPNNDISLDLYYGVHDIGYDNKYNSDSQKQYQKEGNETIFFCLYVCEAEYSPDVVNDVEVPDYKSINNYHFIKEISEKEAFSDEYGFTISYWDGIVYNHSEKITFPTEFLTNEEGCFVIKLVALRKPTIEGDKYYVSMAGDLEIQYHTLGENETKLIF